MAIQPTYGNRVLVKRLYHYVLPFWPILLLGILTNILYSGIDASFTYLAKPFLDDGVIDQNLEFIVWIPIILFVGISARGIVSSSADYCMTWVARHVVNTFRQQLFRHILRLPAHYFDNSSTGQLLSKILYNVEQVSKVSADALTTLVQSIFLIIGLLIVMFVINWQLSSLFLITVPFVAAIVRYTSKRVRRVSHAIQRSMGKVTEIAEESIEGYRVVRIFGGEDYEAKKFNEATEISRRQDMKIAATKAYNVAGVQMIIAIGMAMIMLVAIQLSSFITTTPGGFVAIFAAMLQIIKPMKNLTTVTSVIQRGLAGAESIFKLLDVAAEPDQGTKIIEKPQGGIQYKQVNFTYQPNKVTHILRDINLTIKPGQTVALVGRSGSGKSTLVSLLPRFYEASQGSILIDGINIKDLTLVNLRKQIAVVSQQVTLFNDTIAKNIAYGQFQATDRDAIVRAAISSHAMEFISRLPEGLDTLVGENGILLSGGQRQRLAIARAILKNAPILILDEATSALDTESERHIQAALVEVMHNRTTLVIAHRLSTIERAHQIAVLDAGKIVEVGTHQELLSLEGHYAKLYHMQFQNLAVKVTQYDEAL